MGTTELPTLSFGTSRLNIQPTNPEQFGASTVRDVEPSLIKFASTQPSPDLVALSTSPVTAETPPLEESPFLSQPQDQIAQVSTIDTLSSPEPTEPLQQVETRSPNIFENGADITEENFPNLINTEGNTTVRLERLQSTVAAVGQLPQEQQAEALLILVALATQNRSPNEAFSNPNGQLPGNPSNLSGTFQLRTVAGGSGNYGAAEKVNDFDTALNRLINGYGSEIPGLASATSNGATLNDIVSSMRLSGLSKEDLQGAMPLVQQLIGDSETVQQLNQQIEDFSEGDLTDTEASAITNALMALPEDIRKNVNTDRLTTAYNFYIEAGFTPEATAALLGTAIQESVLFGADNNLFQWMGSRTSGMPSTFEGQLEFSLADMRRDSPRVYTALQSVTNLNDANALVQDWIRAGHLGPRSTYANVVYQHAN